MPSLTSLTSESLSSVVLPRSLLRPSILSSRCARYYLNIILRLIIMCVIIDEFMNAYMLVIPQANTSVISAISHIGSQIRTSAAL